MSRGHAKTRTFSIRPELIEILEKEARSRGISTSALMNQIIERSINLVWPSEKTGALVISRDIIQELLQGYSISELEKMGALAAQKHKSNAIILMGTKQNVESVLELIQTTYGKNSQWFKYTHDLNGKKNRILLNHEMGMKWSIFLASYMKSFFIEMLDIPMKSSIMDNTVVLEFSS